MRENAHFTVEITKAGIYAVLEYDKSFTDVTSDHWVYAALKQLAARHIVNGVSEEEFAPEDPMTRAEFAVLLARLLGVGAESAKPSISQTYRMRLGMPKKLQQRMEQVSLTE